MRRKLWCRFPTLVSEWPQGREWEEEEGRKGVGYIHRTDPNTQVFENANDIGTTAHRGHVGTCGLNLAQLSTKTEKSKFFKGF